MAQLTITKETDKPYELTYVLRDVREAAKGVENLTVGYVGEDHYPTQVTLIGPAPAIQQVFRHFYRDDDAVMSAAENLEYQKYRKIITNAAQGIRDEIAAGDVEDEGALTEAIESASEVIYYNKAALTLRHSSNDTAYDDAGLGEREQGDDCLWASFAQAADIREELGDIDDLLDRLSPLTNDEKEEARNYVLSEIASRPDEAYSRTDIRDLYDEAAESIRHTTEGQDKVYNFLVNDGETPNL